MEKIFILGNSRTASKFYREVLNRSSSVYILHEIMFNFRFKIDVYSILKKYSLNNNLERLNQALEEIYSTPFFRNFIEEYPDRLLLAEKINKLKKLDWRNYLDALVELKAELLKKEVAGAKNSVHFSYAPKVLRSFDDVKVIYLLRDPRSIYASEILMKYKESKLSQFPRMKNKSLQRLLIFAHTNLEWIWAVITYKRIRRRVLLCKYEDLVKSPEPVMRKVFSYCNLNFEEEFLSNVGVVGSSFVKNNEEGVSDHGLQRWHGILNRFEKTWFKFLMFIFNYRV